MRRIVIDHLGNPPIASRAFEPWATLLRRAAQAPNVYANVSGLDAGDADDWSAAELAPYVEHAIDVFGPERLMFGSNWPVAVMRGGYAKSGGRRKRRLRARRRMSGITFWAGRRSASTGLPIATR